MTKWFVEEMEIIKSRYKSEISTLIPLTELKEIQVKAGSCLFKLKIMYDKDRFSKKLFSELKENIANRVKGSKNEITIEKDHFKIMLNGKNESYIIILRDGEKVMKIAERSMNSLRMSGIDKKKVLEDVVDSCKRMNFKNEEEVKSYIKEMVKLFTDRFCLKTVFLEEHIYWESDKEEPWMSALRSTIEQTKKELDGFLKEYDKKMKEHHRQWEEEWEKQRKEKEETENHFREMFS